VRKRRRRSSKYSSQRPVEDITEEDLDNIAITVKDKIYDKVLVSGCCFLCSVYSLEIESLLAGHLVFAKRFAFLRFWRVQLCVIVGHKQNFESFARLPWAYPCWLIRPTNFLPLQRSAFLP